MDLLSQWLNASIKDFTHPLFKDVVKIDTNIEPIGDGQVIVISEIKRVKLTLFTSTGDKRELNVIAKIEPQEGPGKEIASDTGAFATEIMAYNEILKSMEALMEENNDVDHLWPDCYLAKDNKFLLQDLCEDGYRIIPTYEFLDVDHTLLVMKAIGKFHGLSLVMKQRSLFDTTKLGKPFFAKPNPGMESMQKKYLDDIYEAVQSWGPQWSGVPDRLKKYLDKPNKVCDQLWEETKGKWDVINHGDFSMRNMLFHFEDGAKKPDGVKFVDFQMCHLSNFAFDLALLLYSSLLPSVRDKNMDAFLQCYTESFVTTTKMHGYSGPLPTFEDVQQSLKRLHCLCNFMTIFQLLFFMQSQKDDIQKRADEFIESYSNGGDEKEASFVDLTDPDIVNVLQSELKRCMDQGYF